MMKHKRLHLSYTIIRNAAWNVLFVVCLFILLNTFFLAILDYEAARILDNHLDHELEHFMNTVHLMKDSLIVDNPKELMETDLTVLSPTSFFLQIYSPSQKMLLQSPNVTDFGRIPPVIPLERDAVTFQSLRIDDHALRVIYAYLPDENGAPSAIMQLAAFKVKLSQFMPVLFKYNLVSFPFVLIFVVAGSILLAHKSFAPLNKIIELANSISATELERRLDYKASSNDELGRLRDTLNNLFDRLESQFQKIVQFTDNASHQLMSPLTVLKSELEYILRKTPEHHEHREIFVTMSEQTERMIKIVRTLLILAKEDRARHDERLVFNLSKLLTGMKDIYVQHDLKLKIENDLYVRGNDEYFAMAIQNLIDNALKYSEANAEVTLSAASDGEKVIVKVCDLGVGIPAEEREKIFNRFYRFENGAVQHRSGFGLGLSLVRTVVTAMNGTIEVYPNYPKGSCFVISLEALAIE